MEVMTLKFTAYEPVEAIKIAWPYRYYKSTIYIRKYVW